MIADRYLLLQQHQSKTRPRCTDAHPPTQRKQPIGLLAYYHSHHTKNKYYGHH